jgi:hypothetical protein
MRAVADKKIPACAGIFLLLAANYLAAGAAGFLPAFFFIFFAMIVFLRFEGLIFTYFSASAPV